jgi:hypothetical protein
MTTECSMGPWIGSCITWGMLMGENALDGIKEIYEC